MSILPRSELTSFSLPQQVQSQHCRSLLLFARVWQGGRSGRNTTSWSHARLDTWKLLIFGDFAETFLLPIEVQFRNPQFLAHDKWKEHNIISNRNQNSYNYNQICASVDCSTAKDSTDRVNNEHVYWMNREIIQGSCPEFCFDQWATYKSSFKFGLSVIDLKKTHRQFIATNILYGHSVQNYQAHWLG